MDQSLILWILGVILTIVSFSGMLLPVVPGAPLLFLGGPGILLEPFVGAVIGELSLQCRLNAVSRVGFGTVVDLAIGVAGKLAIGIAMIGLFLVKRFI